MPDSNLPTQQTSGLGGFVGTSVRRVEDKRLLTGHGKFVADVQPEGCLHAAFLRSPYPHALIVSIDAKKARALSGVVTIVTGAHMEKLTNPFLPFATLPGLYTPLYYPLSAEKVRMVGDPVAIVVAVSRAVAEDALELIEVNYEQLPPVANIDQALTASSKPLWERAKSNLLFDHTDTFGDVDSVFTKADHVFTETFSCPRQSNQPMEPRGTLVEVDPKTGEITVRSATQSPHMLRWMIAAYTERQGVGRSVKRFAGDKKRRSRFLSGAKSFLAEKGEALKSTDNAGMIYQMKMDPSTMKHMSRTMTGVAGKERYVKVVADDIGGGFGAKGSVAREDIAVTAVAMALGRSVTWIEDRVENLMDGGQAREERMTLSIAADSDGTVRGLKVDLIIDQGAYPGAPVGAALTTRMMQVMQPGSYRFEAFQQRSRIVCTNKGKYVAYRGPWANETWARERMINVVARRLGLSQTDIRIKNMYTEQDFPAAMLTGPTLDVTMSTRKTLDRAIELAALPEFEKERQEAAAQGRCLGIGFACYHEAAPGPPNYWESINPGTSALLDQPSRATVDGDGRVTIFTTQMPHGQSHETTFAQIAADQLGVDIDDVKVVYGDTSKTPFEMLGTGGSRGGPVGGGAVRKVGRALRKELVNVAAEMLEASVDDIVITKGNIHVAGVPSRGLSFGQVAARSLAIHPSTSGDANPVAFDVRENYTSAGDGGWSVATHVCWVEVDLETGFVKIPRYLVVEDCGPIINPAIVDGQVRGGVAQGIGAVLYERVAYDDQANLQSTTYMDYLLPTAMEVPAIEIEHLETLSPGENDFRGVGEGGMIGAPAAIANAIDDALASRGVTITEQYLPPSRILELAGIIEPD